MSAVPGNIRQFVRAKKGKTRWRVAPRYLEVFETFLKDGVRKAPRGQGPFKAVKSGPGKGIYRWDGAPCGGTVFLKIYVRNYWRYLLRYTPAEKEARAISRAQEAGVGTSDLIGFGRKIRFPRAVESLLLTASSSSAVTLGRRWAELLIARDGGGKPDVLRDLEALLPEARRLHDCGISHDDMNPGNVIFEETGNRFIFIDFHRCRPMSTAGPGGRARDLLKLYLYLKPWFSQDELEKALEHYFQGDSDLRREVLGAWDGAREELFRRRVEGVVSACLRSRREFRRFTQKGMVVCSCTEFSPDEILGFVEGNTHREGWHAERHDYRSAFSGIWASLSGSAARRMWIEEVRNCAMGNEAPIPVALVEKRRGHRLFWDLLIRNGRRKVCYAVENRFSLEAFR